MNWASKLSLQNLEMPSRSEEGEFIQIHILPVGRIEEDVVSHLRGCLNKIFPKAKITLIEKEVPIPREAFNPLRRQYHSTRVLWYISRTVKKEANDKILGITSFDLYVPWLNFVFGEAQCPGRVAIISLHRLSPEFYGHPPNKDLFTERTTKEAIHELGHTLGLTHCENPKCVMAFSNSILDTDYKNSTFCSKCAQLIKCV